MVSLAKREEESETPILIHKRHVQQYISIPVALCEAYAFGAPRDAEASWVHTSIFLRLARGERKLNIEALAKRDQPIIVKVAVVDARSSSTSIAAGKILQKRPMAPIWLFKRPS